MKILAVTQRVDIHHAGNERRDAVDQRLLKLLHVAGFMPLALPNNRDLARQLIEKSRPEGYVFSGGNDLTKYGGDAPERDTLEADLLAYAEMRQQPLLGICRGMQLIQDYYGQTLQAVEDQVTAHQTITWYDSIHSVNSYHRWGASESPDVLQITATGPHNIVKAVVHKHCPIYGIMWHPERIHPFRSQDISFLQQIFML